ncbi:hypothetical protein M758_UG205300 [Ceratodon purpureus]|nr:hypothetical protein M758_UG205300 [Ceratodon purpureus]
MTTHLLWIQTTAHPTRYSPPLPSRHHSGASRASPLSTRTHPQAATQSSSRAHRRLTSNLFKRPHLVRAQDV